MPPAKIVAEEGGKDDVANVTAAWKHVQKCIALGPPFLRYNDFTERHEFLHFRSEVHQISEEVVVKKYRMSHPH